MDSKLYGTDLDDAGWPTIRLLLPAAMPGRHPWPNHRVPPQLSLFRELR